MGEDVLASYPSPSGRAVTKEITELDEYCRAFIAMCPLAILSTATADGQPDLTPRGGEPGFLRVLGPNQLVLPDRPGNNRLDRSLLVIHVDKAFMYCAKALMRGRVWDPAARVPRGEFPSMGEIMRAHAGGSGPAESQEEMVRRYQPLL